MRAIYTSEICRGWLINLYGMNDSDVIGDVIVHYNRDDNTSIQVCEYSVGDEKGTDIQKAENILADMYDIGGAESREIETIYSTTYIGGKAIVYHCIDWENDAEYWFLEGVKVKGKQYLVSRIWYTKPEHKEWAIDRWNSIIKLEEN